MTSSIKDISLKVLRRVLISCRPKKSIEHLIDLKSQESSDIIKSKILNGKPLFIGRIGATEFSCLTGYIQSISNTNRYFRFIKGDLDYYELDEKIIQQAYLWSGIFPPEKEILVRFAELTLKDLKEIDVLGVWLKEHNLLSEQLEDKIKIPLKDIEPYYHKDPWSIALKGKKVLVIHPFAKSIKHQYTKREQLFLNNDILPIFNLKVLKSVQSIAGESTQFKDWFEALEHMKKQIDEIDFDIAIIGCGAYGFSLGAHIKRMGKQAIHMGGATQLLFGIKGNRWDNHPVISKLYNEHWIRPLNEETPTNKNKVEDGCYW